MILDFPTFYTYSQNCKKWLLAPSFLSVCPSAWNDSAPTECIFLKFCIWGFFKICKKIQVWLISDKKNGYFTLRLMYINDNISLSSSENEKCVRRKLQRISKYQNTFLFNNSVLKVTPFVKSCGKIWSSQTGHKWQICNGAEKLHFAWWMIKARIKTHTLFNTYYC
jgi:hypothetical protein